MKLVERVMTLEKLPFYLQVCNSNVVRSSMVPNPPRFESTMPKSCLLNEWMGQETHYGK